MTLSSKIANLAKILGPIGHTAIFDNKKDGLRFIGWDWTPFIHYMDKKYLGGMGSLRHLGD